MTHAESQLNKTKQFINVIYASLFFKQSNFVMLRPLLDRSTSNCVACLSVLLLLKIMALSVASVEIAHVA